MLSSSKIISINQKLKKKNIKKLFPKDNAYQILITFLSILVDIYCALVWTASILSPITSSIAQSGGAAEYTDRISAEE